MKRIFFLLLLIINTFAYLSAQYKVKTVPNPVNKPNSYVSNPDKILTNEQVLQIDSLLKETEDSSKAQVAVVMLQSIGTEVPKTFATELFNYWGLGTKEANNGLLILFVMDQRRIEFETGYGLETILPDGKCFQIQQDFMVPRFKEGNYGQGIMDGVKQVVEIIMGRYQEISTSTTTSEDYTTTNPNYPENETSVNENIHYYSFLGFYIRTTLLLFLVYFILFSITLFQKDYFNRYKTLRIFKLYIWFILFPVPFVGLYYLTRNLMEKWRNAPRISAKTGKVMHKLSEEEDNKYLQSGQVTEEQVKSIDYDVWVSDEPDDVLILGYKRWFSKYSACPKCKFKTYFKYEDRVIQAATYSSSGRGERKYRCENCKYTYSQTYTIPRKTKSSSSSYSSSSYRSSSSFGGSRSWGGGRSGGGGAGSSW